MILQYHILWPGGNTTALVTNPFPRTAHRAVAREIMSSAPDIEQVGFLERAELPQARYRLQMMGGEFCGNAARSSAYLWGQLRGEEDLPSFEVSGFSAHLRATAVTEDRAGIELPGDFLLSMREVREGILVDLHGIRHLVIARPGPSAVEELVDHYRGGKPCLGIMYATEKDGGIDLDPYVWVEETKTLVHETGCGSGSIAVALASEGVGGRQSPFAVRQPSGETYDISLRRRDGALQSITLDGSMAYRGMGAVELQEALHIAIPAGR